jgi:hypothetical protein
MDRRLTAWVEAHPKTGAIIAGLAAGVLAFLLGLLIFREPVWRLFGVATLGTGVGTYLTAFFRRQDLERLERRRRQGRTRPRLGR